MPNLKNNSDVPKNLIGQIVFRHHQHNISWETVQITNELIY